ncbi:mechanosensitive ion channel protein 10-like [Magnolia sinica]|uniref:mechanosensitive ion channel protein 10-like n=1 Tax=Magnolia sinica TaxID=86752 RepID=UPI00265ADA95|nr:mechanosensitive ion channel protein 10-like [Magnolia sinica]
MRILSSQSFRLKKVASWFRDPNRSYYIENDDLRKFFKKDEVDHIFHLFEGDRETGKIEESAFTEMVVDVFHEQRDLTHSLNEREALMEQLHKLVNAVFIVIIIITSLLVTGVTTTNVIVVITSQLLLLGFIFGNTSKTMFESMVFLFTQNPFDVGDHCVIDGIEMVVEEMEVLTTTFIRFDNERIYYPNVVLLTKPISNFSRSSDMGDIIEFSVDVSTSLEIISEMKEKIKQ